MDEDKRRQLIKRYFWWKPPIKWALIFASLALLSWWIGSQELASCLTTLVFLFLVAWAATFFSKFGFFYLPTFNDRFQPKVRRGVFLVVVTLAAWLASLTPNPTSTLAVLALVTLVPRIVYHALRPAGEKVDEWLDEDLSTFSQKAMQKLNLVEDDLEREPLLVAGPFLNAKDKRAKYAEDWGKTYRFSVHHVLVLLLTRSHLGVLDCLYDSCTGITYNLSLKDVGYEHVVEVEIVEELEIHDEDEKKTYTLRGEQFQPGQVFRLGLAGGHSFKVWTRVRGENHKRSSLQPPGTPLDEISRALRSMKRDRMENLT